MFVFLYGQYVCKRVCLCVCKVVYMSMFHASECVVGFSVSVKVSLGEAVRLAPLEFEYSNSKSHTLVCSVLQTTDTS